MEAISANVCLCFQIVIESFQSLRFGEISSFGIINVGKTFKYPIGICFHQKLSIWNDRAKKMQNHEKSSKRCFGYLMVLFPNLTQKTMNKNLFFSFYSNDILWFVHHLFHISLLKTFVKANQGCKIIKIRSRSSHRLWGKRKRAYKIVYSKLVSRNKIFEISAKFSLSDGRRPLTSLETKYWHFDKSTSVDPIQTRFTHQNHKNHCDFLFLFCFVWEIQFDVRFSQQQIECKYKIIHAIKSLQL